MSCRALIVPLVALVALTACPAAEPVPAPAPIVATPPAVTPTVAPIDYGDWAQYWPAFQQAALAGDREAMLALTDTHGEISAETVRGDLFTTYLSPQVLEVVKKSSAADLKLIEGTAGAADEVREVSFSKTAIVEGEEMGSGLFLHFKRVDGKFKLFRLIAAG